MKKYQKVKLIAKNLPTGSYAAGCPVKGSQSRGSWDGTPYQYCEVCETVH